MKQLIVTTLLLGAACTATAQEWVVQEQLIDDVRPVVAKVQAADKSTARSRLQGVVSTLNIDEGYIVKQGDVVAVITDETLAPKIAALSSRMDSLDRQIEQASADLARAKKLRKKGYVAKAEFDKMQTNLKVLKSNRASAGSERKALEARQTEGRILAPTDARVTLVSVVEGSIVSPGEVLASFASLDGVVRLSLPERHAATLKQNEVVSIRLPGRGNVLRKAKIITIYPEILDGAMRADAVVDGGFDALVGERVDVLAPVGQRRALRIPRNYVSTRYGVDFVSVKMGDRLIDAPVTLAGPATEGFYEVLSGLRAGDIIVHEEQERAR